MEIRGWKKWERADKAIMLVLLSVIAGCMAVALAGCSHGGDVPYPGLPFCAGRDVTPCGGDAHQVMGINYVVAGCTDFDTTMSCQFDTGATYGVAACGSCAQTAVMTAGVTSSADDLARVGVHVCSPLASKGGAWCAQCSDPALSMQWGYSAPPQQEGGPFWAPVACVHDCSACAVWQ